MTSGIDRWKAHVVQQSTEANGVWTVITDDGDGFTSQQTIFRGHDSEQRARQYAVFLTIGWTKGQTLVSDFFSLPVRMEQNEARVAELYRDIAAVKARLGNER